MSGLQGQEQVRIKPCNLKNIGYKLFNFFSKNPTVEFISSIEGVEELMPIIPAAEYKRPWTGRLLEDLKQKRAAPDYSTTRSVHTAKCPGIFNLMRHGWILRTWQDTTIETNGDGVSCQWSSVINQKELCGFEAIGFHPPEQLTGFFENWDGVIQNVIKFQTPWTCKIPAGYFLLEMPVTYSDENRFETLPGYFSSEYGHANMNPQVKWKVPAGKVLIKAGTPIAQYVLVKRDSFNTVVRTQTKRENVLAKLIGENTFVRNVKRFKELNQKLLG
jgi:hypothetical protein